MSMRRGALGKLRRWADLPAEAATLEEQHARLRRQMGIDDGVPLTVIKQYGEYRTGSNALRALLLENFDNALVLMHVLGDKHHDPIDFAALAQALSQKGTDPCWVILNATWARPGGLTRPESFRQQAFVRAFAQPVASSVANGSLRVVLSVRHPLTWIEAVMRFWEWPAQATGDPWLDAEGINIAKGLCRRFNTRYLGWSKMVDDFADHARVVPFETLEADWGRLVGALASVFPLHLRRGHPVSTNRSVEPSPWDNVPPCYAKAKHRKRASKRRLARRELEAIVNDGIDWALLERFGYGREPSEPARSAAGLGFCRVEGHYEPTARAGAR